MDVILPLNLPCMYANVFVQALGNSEIVELHSAGDRLRQKVGWQKWVVTGGGMCWLSVYCLLIVQWSYRISALGGHFMF